MKKIFSLAGLMAAAALTIMLFASASGTPNSGLKRARPEAMGMDGSKFVLADSIINKAIADKNTSGAVLAVVRKDKLVYLKAYGNKQIVPTVEPMTTETIFDLASLSKCVGTTLSFMQLIEKGQVRLHDDVDEYIDGFKPWVKEPSDEEIVRAYKAGKTPRPRKEYITIENLLTHTSGLPAYTNVASCVKRFGENCPDSLMMHIATELPRLFKPGTAANYSCLNFVTLQNVLQNVTGMKLCDYAKKNVYDVLGLKHTMYLPLDRPVPEEIRNLVAPTEIQADGLPLSCQVHDPIARLLNNGNSGNAGVFSNAEDLAVIAAALLNGGAINGKRILSPLTIEQMMQVPEDIAPGIGRALGWDNCSGAAGPRGDLTSRHRSICHTGYTGPSMTIDFDNDLAVILLCNRCHPEDKGGLGRTRGTVANVFAASIIK